MNTVDLINAYPFWGPANAGPAKRFASPYVIIETQLREKLKDLPVSQQVPQETRYQNTWSHVMQLIPAYVPAPQAPVQARDPYAQARTLLDYASQSLGSSNMGNADKRGA